VANDEQGQQIQHAIACGNAAVLRRMAAAADREEGRMWLTLLARMLELDARRKRRQKVRARGLVVLPTASRVAARRAG